MAKNSEATLLLRIKTAGEEALGKVKDGLEVIGEKAKWAALAIVGAMVASVKNFSDAEDASNKLTQAIRNQGLNATALKKQYDELAEAIQKKSTFDDDEIIAGIAAAQSMAGRIRLTDALIKATVDFAAATGTDLNSAFEKVGKSIGTSTNALAREGVELSETATASEKMARITEVLNSRFEGQAEILSMSAGGSVKQMWNALGNLSEVMGAVLAPTVIKSANALTKWLETSKSIANGKFALNLAQEFEKAFEFITSGLHLIGLNLAKVTQFGKGLWAAITNDKEGAQRAGETAREIAAEIERVSANTKAEQAKIDHEYNAKRAGASLETDKKIAKQSLGTHTKFISDKELKLQEELKKDQAAAKKAVEDFKEFEWKKVEAAQAAREQYIKDWEAGMAKAGDFTQTALSSGFKGASKKILSDAVGKLIPGFGGAAGEMFELLSQDSDKFLETINTLFSTKFLDNIANNIPILIERFADAMPGIIERLNEQMPRIVEALIESMIENSPRMAMAMAKTFSNPEFTQNLILAIANGFANGVRDGWAQALTLIRNSDLGLKFGEQLIDAGGQVANTIKGAISIGGDILVQDLIFATHKMNELANFGKIDFSGIATAIRDGIAELPGALADALKKGVTGGGGGGGGNILGAIVGGAVGGPAGAAAGWNMAAGGTVKPLYAAGGAMVPRGTDTVPAMLTPGEFVVNAAAAGRNRSMLEAINSGGGSGGGMVVNITVNGGLLGDQQTAQQFAKAIDSELLKLRQKNQSVAFDRATF